MTEAEAEIYEKLLKIGDRKDDDEYEGYVIGDAMKKLDDATGENGSEEKPEQKHDWKGGFSLCTQYHSIHVYVSRSILHTR